MLKNNSQKTKMILFISTCVLIILVIIMPIIFKILPKFLYLFKIGGKEAASKYLRSFGINGIIIIFILQIIQVLSLVIPAPTVWVVAGVTYGVFGGMIICIFGVVIGNSIAFYIGKRYGNKLVDNIINEDKRNKLKFLEKSKHSDIIEFLLYVIPGLPNDIIPYIYARTNISFKRFITIIAIASVPAILSCTYIGDNILSGNFIAVIIIFIIAIVLMAIVFKSNKQIFNSIEKMSSKDKETIDD
jgi:uncharacterized membrane protein YdjX (TVP38/TMEM64 family)